MTVSSELNRKQYAGNGVTTSFATSPVVFFDTSDLVVYVVTTATGAATTLTEDTHYTVSGGSGSTGTVSLAGGSNPYGAPASTQTVVIVRDVPLTQAVDLVQNDASDAEVVEDALDKLTMADQQLSARLDRSFTLADSDVSGASLTVPTPSANKLVGWNSAGTALENKTPADIDLVTVTAFVETLLDDATAAEARTTLGAAQKVVTTKGDLHVGGAAGAESRKAVGTNGQVLTVDSAQTDGMAWAYKRYAPCGRLTLTSATAVTADDVTGASTVYFTPYNGDVIELYDGAGWIPKQFTELSQATSDTTKSPAAVANNSNYDVFVWSDAGTLRATRGPAWSSDTARGTGAGTTELELLEGRYVNKVAITNGPAAQRGTYVGTIRSDGSAQINDSLAKRHVWNNYNRRTRTMRSAVEATDSWTYTTATFRQANNNAANQLDYVVGLAEDAVTAKCLADAFNSGGVAAANVGIGVDSTTANSATISGGVNIRNDQQLELNAFYSGIPGLGRHFLAWLEYAQASGTTTWRGDGGTTGLEQSGIFGEVLA